MTEDQLKDYRKTLEKDFTEKDCEIDTALSYISVGALGFFITMNEKFLKLQSAHFRFFLIISILSLFISFILILIRKNTTRKYDLLLMDIVDNTEPNTEGDQAIKELWVESHNKLGLIRKFVFYFLSIGIGFQVVFFLLNI